MHIHTPGTTHDGLSLPANVIIIQTARGRFQIDVSEDGIRVVCLDIDGEIAVYPRTANIVDIQRTKEGGQ